MAGCGADGTNRQCLGGEVAQSVHREFLNHDTMMVQRVRDVRLRHEKRETRLLKGVLKAVNIQRVVQD